MILASLLTPMAVSVASPVSQGGPATKMHVQDVAMSWGVQQGNKFYGEAVATVVDGQGNPVGGATVYGQWSGAASDGDEAATGGDGQTGFIPSDAVRGGGDFTFCVTNVVLVGMSYDVAANVETCDSVAAPPSGGGPAKWTFMVYIVGDNDLESYVTRDIETELGYSNADVNVVAIADRHPGYDQSAGDWTSTKLFYITSGMEATAENALADWGERNMGDPQTLIDFVQWAQAGYPAEHYALILWDHGWAWRPYQSMWDETDDDTLDMHELEYAMGVVGPVDVLGYDACEGMAIENMTLWRSLGAQAIAGSQEDFGMVGFEYEQVLPALQADPYMTAGQLAVQLADSAIQQNWTSSAAALDANFDALVTAIDEWSVALLAGLPVNKAAYDAAWRFTEQVADPLNKDLYDAANEINQRVSDPTIQATGQAVMDAVNAVVLYEWHKGSYRDAHGIGIFWPKEVADLDEPSSPQWNDFQYYRDYLLFAQLTRWDEFLDAYVNGQ
jgi:hypothetical protein